MKFQKTINELNNLLDSAASEHEKHQKKLKFFLDQFKNEEKSLLKKLEKENDRTNRKKLKRELRVVKEAYTLLGAA